MQTQPPLILASQSRHRASLLKRLGVSFTVHPAHVDETPLKGETPLAYVKRIALAKAAKVAEEKSGQVVLAADTPVIVGRRILQTPKTREEAAGMLRLQSGRRVHIPTVVAVANAQGKLTSKTADSWIKFKVLSEAEINDYLKLDLWKYTSGALSIEAVEHWVVKMQGSVSAIIGLPLYETSLLLRNAGVTLNPYKEAIQGE